jgi:hypothetical protein
MTLGTLRSRVGQALNVAGGGTVAGAELTLLDGYINEAVEQILLRSKVNKKTAAVALTSGVGDYTLDPIMLAFDDMWIAPAANPSWTPMLYPVDSYDIRAMRLSQSIVAAPSTYYAYEGNVIMLYPSPGTGDVLHIVYVPRPNAMTATGNDPSIAPYGEVPTEFHPLIESYAKWKMADYADDASSQLGQSYMQEYEMGLDRMKGLLTKKAGIRTGYAKVGNRRRYLTRFAPPGVDIRG